jgi:hypothetical protein
VNNQYRLIDGERLDGVGNQISTDYNALLELQESE